MAVYELNTPPVSVDDLTIGSQVKIYLVDEDIDPTETIDALVADLATGGVYTDPPVAGAVHIATCQDISLSTDTTTTDVAVHGQSSKITMAGATSYTVSFSMLQFKPEFYANIMGRMVGDIWVTDGGWRSMRGLVGVKYEVDPATQDIVPTMYYGFGNINFTSFSEEYPTEDVYTSDIEASAAVAFKKAVV